MKFSLTEAGYQEAKAWLEKNGLWDEFQKEANPKLWELFHRDPIPGNSLIKFANKHFEAKQ